METDNKKVGNYKNIIIVVLILILGIGIGYNLFNLKTDSPPGISSGDNPDSTCILGSEARDFVGDYKCVEYFVSNLHESDKGNIFLNEKRDYKNGFTTVIFNNSRDNFSNPKSKYSNKKIQVTGLIKVYNGQVEIIAETESQIKVID